MIVTAIERLEHWLSFAENWCDHNPSATISVKDDEWLEVGAWVYKNFDKVLGLTFLPHDDHVYQQAPYEEITEQEYEAALEQMPESIDWSLLYELEKEDNTTSGKELSCVAGACEV